MRAGMVAVPFSYKLPRETLEHIARDAELRTIFHEAGRAAELPDGPEKIALDAPGLGALLDFGGHETHEPEPREVGMMLYTSGSTWMPKGVLLSHDSQRWSLERGERLFGDRADHVYIVAAPMAGAHQACVVPVPHETKGAAPFAFVVPRAGAVLSEDMVRGFTLAHGPAHADPRHVRFIEAIPLAGTSKPDRRPLTEEARALGQDRTRGDDRHHRLLPSSISAGVDSGHAGRRTDPAIAGDRGARPPSVGRVGFPAADSGVEWAVIHIAMPMTSPPRLIGPLTRRTPFVQSVLRAGISQPRAARSRRPNIRPRPGPRRYAPRVRAPAAAPRRGCGPA
jgi:hypothetical protein